MTDSITVPEGPQSEERYVMKITLEPGETTIDTWTLMYAPPGGGKYNGKLTITNKRLLYDVKLDVSVKGLISEALFAKWGSEGYLTLNKDDITKVEVEKKLLSKKCRITLSDGSVHTFDYGFLNIDKVATAVQAR